MEIGFYNFLYIENCLKYTICLSLVTINQHHRDPWIEDGTSLSPPATEN